MTINVFVSFGTHEQQFDRLMSWVKNLSQHRSIRLTIQNGFTMIPKDLVVEQAERIMTHAAYLEKISSCDVFITQSSPGNIYSSLERHRLPIVVPRLKRFGEHVDDHQALFGKFATDSQMALMAEVEETLLGEFDSLVKLGLTGQKNRTKRSLLASKKRTQEFVVSLSSFLEQV